MVRGRYPVFSGFKKFNKINLGKEKRNEGVYKYYNQDKTLLYVGVSNEVKLRLLSAYYGRSDYAVLENKKKLRQNIAYYKVKYCGLDQARKIEHRIKKQCKYNLN
ncbi:hypothetical protein [Methanococcus voltae]|uniref:GIY-YIG domain-containing protein n=1 Tax=Methanococcus voltae (strain ATCC BAA-1334 / A3) TaxID=456320 RepID=D7DRB0_METV3|nr:hypothetical protein [Methanococcus voltae]MCS3901047.1 excinuclease UvrABC nuclease subunit [Methanococcus voltae]